MKNRFGALLMIAALASACSTSEQKLAAQHERDPQYQYEKAVVCMNAGLADEALKISGPLPCPWTPIITNPTTCADWPT